MQVPQGVSVGVLKEDAKASAIALVQGCAVEVHPGLSCLPGWSDGPELELVFRVAPGVHASVDGQRRARMFVLRPGQSVVVREAFPRGEPSERRFTFVAAAQVPVLLPARPSADRAVRSSDRGSAQHCALCRSSLSTEAVLVETIGLAPEWRALAHRPLCEPCGSALRAESCRPAGGARAT